ncbi:uncharacterized protein LOC113325349 [Papaver somniferum]|uniref:uncharacterized protein LOC113325349 n=1 Tax=Papaver somniferum TaxID=3469 RepID=UPI000E705980|nr:uncharacterized protein LOC113325349 [Papaver somniferum]
MQARLKRPMQHDQVVNEQILRELAEMREIMTTRREGARRQLDEAIEEAGKTPFAEEIQLAGIPPKCSLPAFTNIFDETTCAIQHIKAYVRSLLQWEDHDAVLCEYFPASLSGATLKWFDGLHTGTIRSFNHLQSILRGAYISNNVLRPGIEQEEYIVLEEKQKEMESYPMANTNTKARKASLLPKITNTIASTSQGRHKKAINEYQQKLVAMGSRDKEEWEREKYFNNRGGNNKIQRHDNTPEGYGGQKKYFNQGQRGHKVVWEPTKMPHLNATIKKIWESIIFMEETPAPPNAENEPPQGRRSRELCAYHRFHGHTTNNCRDTKKIIL